MDYRISRSGIVEHSHPVAGHWGGMPQWHRANIWHRNQPDAHRVFAASSMDWLVLRGRTVEQATDLAITALVFADATGSGVRRWTSRTTATGAPATSNGSETSNLRTMSPRRFGVEIECILPNRAAFSTLVQNLADQGIILAEERYGHSTPTNWKAVPDGSLHGARYPEYTVEIVSPVLANAAGMAQLKAVCEGLQAVGGRVNTSCGLHVHHDAADLTLEDVQHLIAGYTGSQAAINSFLRAYRRNSRWCQPYRAWDVESIDRARDIRSMCYDRYRTVNTLAYAAHGTIELRQFHATLSYNDISAWVRMGQAMVACAQRGNRTWGDSLDEMMASLMLNQADRRYFTNMAARRTARSRVAV